MCDVQSDVSNLGQSPLLTSTLAFLQLKPHNRCRSVVNPISLTCALIVLAQNIKQHYKEVKPED